METTGTETEVKAEVTEPVQPPAAQSPTAEERLKTLEAELTQAKTQLTQAQDGYKGLQRTLNKSNEELRRQAEFRSDIDSLKEQQKILAAMIAESRDEESPDIMSQDKKQGLLERYNAQIAQQEQKRKEVELETRRKEYNEQANQVWTEAQKIETMPKRDKKFIESLLKGGDIEGAREVLSEFQQEKTKVEVPKESKKETDEEIFMRIARDKGLLKTDTVVPSGRARSREDIIKGYANGDPNVSEADYTQALGRG